MRNILILAFIFGLGGYATQAQDSRTVETRDKMEVDENGVTNSSRDEVYRKSWALLIGINKYPNVYEDNEVEHGRLQLKFAVKDVLAMRELLIDFGFAQNQIFQLIDEEATKKTLTIRSQISLITIEFKRAIVY